MTEMIDRGMTTPTAALVVDEIEVRGEEMTVQDGIVSLTEEMTGMEEMTLMGIENLLIEDREVAEIITETGGRAEMMGGEIQDLTHNEAMIAKANVMMIAMMMMMDTDREIEAAGMIVIARIIETEARKAAIAETTRKKMMIEGAEVAPISEVGLEQELLFLATVS